MRCPNCIKEGKKSCAYETGRGGMRILGHERPYYDEKGEYHNHNMTVNWVGLECTHGHTWKGVTHNKCWCGWSTEDKEI